MLYNLKRSGYQAMNSGDWIRAYYIFRELLELTPDDPDAVNFLAASERGTKQSAFFTDEMALSLGEILTGAVFSLPGAAEGSRAVLRFSSLSTSQDYAYGMGLEYLGFDALARPVEGFTAHYAKLLPFSMDGKQQVLILMRALDRHDRNLRWEPEWTLGLGPAGSADAKIVLDISFEDFLLLAEARRGLPGLQFDELFAAPKIFAAAGHVPEVFEAEALNRLGAVLFFLSMGIFSIVIGWRFRARNKPRYIFIPLLAVLPVVFHGIVILYRTVLNIAGIWLVISLGFSAALAVFCAAMALCFLVSLITLAAQHDR
jgi:hypothetical protein